jgi:TonB-dependent SusC/RagA subfamily outer membrane receptor
MVVTVMDRQAGTPLEGAQVNILQGGASVQGGLTNAQGRALFAVLPVGTYDLTVTYLGYGEVQRVGIEIQAGQPTAVNIDAETSVLTLDELVVTGMVDPTSGIKVPFTVAKIGTEQLQVAASGSAPLSALAGKVAGLNVQVASGRPGETAEILLRSATSFEGSNQPLIVVDGVIMSTSMTNGDALSDIESMDIVDFEVIKGAAAASLYGSRAAAGVIAITTARGRSAGVGQTRVTFRSEFGKDFIAGEIPLTNSHPYLMNEAGTSLVNSEGRDTTWGGRTTRVVEDYGGNARMMDQPYPGKIYDNVSGVYKPDQYLSSNVTLAQNSENTQFLIGLTRLDQNGALENNDGFWRNTGRVSIDHRMGKLSVSFTGSHSRQWQDGISGNPYTSLLTYPAYVDLTKKDADGKYLQQPDETVEIENPIWRQASRDNFSERARTLGSMNARFAPFNWLTIDAQVSYDLSDDHNQTYVPKGVPLDLTGDNPASGSLYLEHETTQGANGSLGATFMRQFGELNVRFTSRGSFERE